MPLPPDDSGSAPSEYAALCAFPAYSTTYNVKSAPYNAVGDGVADDTVAIQAAINAAIAGGGHAFVYFPTGTYAVCRQTDTHASQLYQPIFDLTSADTKDPSNLCFIGDGPTLSIIKGYMPSLGDPVTAYQQSTLGSPNPQMSRFIMFFTGFVVHWSNLQFRSLTIDGQAGYTGDFTVGGSSKYVTFSVTTPGTGYSVNDILEIDGTLVANFPTEYATIKVLSINGGGGVLTASLQTAGRYGSIPVSAKATIGGGGTGCTVTPVSTALTGDGWDQLHKAFFLFEGDDCLIYNCDTKNWKGECIFGGSNQAVSIVNGNVRGSNSSAISIGADLIVSDMTIGGLTTDQVYNGTENFCFEAGQKTIIKRCTVKNDPIGNGLVHLGVSGSSLLVNDCEIYGTLLLSEVAFDVTISDNTFHQCSIRTSNLSLYPESIGFTNFTIERNTHVGKSDGFTTSLLSLQNGVSGSLTISENTAQRDNSPTYLLSGDFFQTGAVVTGNALTGGAIDITDDFGHTQVGLWTDTVRAIGTGSIQYGLSTNGNGDTSTIFPLTDATKLTSANTNTHYVEIDDTLMSRYPDGFETKFRMSASNLDFRLKENALWNTFSGDVSVYENLKIRLNNDRLFEVVPMPIPDTLIAYWKCEENPAGTPPQIIDATGNGLDGTTNGTMLSGQSVTGKILQGLSLDGVDDYIDFSNNAALAPVALSVSMWVNPTSLVPAYSALYSRAGTGQRQIFVKSTGKLAVYFAGSTGGGDVSYDGTGSHTLVTGTWYHICVTYDSTAGLVAYVNGASDATVAALGNLAANTNAMTVGQDTANSGRKFGGIVDEIGTWSRALTAAEVTTLYNGGAGLAYPLVPPVVATTHLSFWRRPLRKPHGAIR